MTQSSNYSQGPAITDSQFACAQSAQFHLVERLVTPVFHFPGETTAVSLPKYTISWDGTAQCEDLGEIVFECLGCDEHHVRIDQKNQILEIETTNDSKGSFEVKLAALTKTGRNVDDFVLQVQVKDDQVRSAMSQQNYHSFDLTEWNVL